MQVVAAFEASRAAPLCRLRPLENVLVRRKCRRLSRSEPAGWRAGRRGWGGGRHTCPGCAFSSPNVISMQSECPPGPTCPGRKPRLPGSPTPGRFSGHGAGSPGVSVLVASALLRAPEVQIHLLRRFSPPAPFLSRSVLCAWFPMAQGLLGRCTQPCSRNPCA